MWRNLADAPVLEAGCWRFKSSHPHWFFSRRSLIGRARARHARGRELESPRRLLMLFESSTFGRVDYRRGAANPVRAVRFRQRAPNFDAAEVSQSAQSSWCCAELKPPSIEGLTPSFGIANFLRVGKCSVRSHKPRPAGSVTQTRNHLWGVWQVRRSRQLLKLKIVGSNPTRPVGF